MIERYGANFFPDTPGRSPDYRVPFREKLKWTGVILILYFVLTNVTYLA